MREPTLYIEFQIKFDTLIITLYVDDCIYIANNKKMVQEFKKAIMKAFEIINFGLMHYFLGIKIDHQEGVLIIWKKYAEDFLKKYKINYCKIVTTHLVTNETLLEEV